LNRYRMAGRQRNSRSEQRIPNPPQQEEAASVVERRHSDDPEGGLRRFLASYADLRRTSRSSPKYLRLAAFLAQAGILLQPRAFVSQIRDPDEFRRVLKKLKDPLHEAKAQGAFLQVWAIAGLRRNERRNAAVLAWLLNPRGSHGCGASFLSALFQKAAQRMPNWPSIGPDLGLTTVETEEAPIGSERDRVDIALDGPDFVLFIEVKIDALEGAEQLLRYVESARAKATAQRKNHALIIYLAPHKPVNPPSEIAVINWRDVASALSETRNTGFGGVLARQYVNHIRSFYWRF
jgi:hypothetical protein